MSVVVDGRSPVRFLPRGLRRFLNTNDSCNSANPVEVGSNTPADHVYAMFQGAQHTHIQRPIFNIYAAGVPTGDGSPSDSIPPSQLTSDESTDTSLRTNFDPITVLPAEPIPAAKTSPEIYVHHLLTKNRGYPLWIPSPSMLLPTFCRTSGVQIGDVAIITPEGGFSYLFNLFHEATHPINASMRLPVDFVPVMKVSDISLSDVDQFKESSAGGYLADESMVRMDAGDDRSKTILKTSAPHAALLMTPEPVYASKLKNTIVLRKYVQKNIKGWYRFLRTVLGREVENGDLRVVYGCRKSAAFGIATVTNCNLNSGGAGAQSTELTFSIDDSWTEITGCKYGWHHRGCAEVKSGPSLDENRDIRQLEEQQRDRVSAALSGQDPQSGTINNQCLFISTIDVTLSESEWAHIDDDDEPVPVTTSSQSPSTPLDTTPETHPESPSAGRSDSGHHSLFGPECSKRMHTLPPQSAHILGTQFEREFCSTTSPSKKLFDPSDALSRFLLQMVPQATSVALCSDDWGPYMTSAVQTLGTLINNVLSAHDIHEDHGMIYLRPKKDRSSTHLPELMSVAMLPELSARGRSPHSSTLVSVQCTASILKTRAAVIYNFLYRMLLKTPSTNARPFHITVKLSDIIAVNDIKSGDCLRCGLLSELQAVFPERSAKKYVVHVVNDNRANSARSTNNATINMPEESPHFAIHPLLVCSECDVLLDHIPPLIRDLNGPPDDAHLLENPSKLLSAKQLLQHATTPPTTESRQRIDKGKFFKKASDIDISGITFMSVDETGTFVNNMNSNNVVDSYNTQSTATYDSHNNNSKQFNGSGNIKSDNSLPQLRNRPPPQPVPDWSRQGPQQGYGGPLSYGGGYQAPPYGGQTINSYNTRNDVYTGSYNDNSYKQGVSPPGDRGPNTKKRPGQATGEAWMEDDHDNFMGGPSRNPRAGGRKAGPWSPHSPYDQPLRGPQGFSPGGPMGRGVGGGARMMNVPDMHVSSPGGGHMSVQNPQIASLPPSVQRHMRKLFPSLNDKDANEEGSSDSEESEEAEDKTMLGSGPSRTLSSGIANMTLNDNGQRTAGDGPARRGMKWVANINEVDEDEEMDDAPQTSPAGSTSRGAAAPSTDNASKKKKKTGKKQSANAAEDEEAYDQSADYTNYFKYLDHPGAYGSGQGRGMEHAPYPPPPPGYYALGGPYPDPHFQQRYPYNNSFGHPGHYPPYGAPGYGHPPRMSQGSGNVHNLHMENAYNDNSYVEYHGAGADDAEAGEDDGHGNYAPADQERRKGMGIPIGYM